MFHRRRNTILTEKTTQLAYKFYYISLCSIFIRLSLHYVSFSYGLNRLNASSEAKRFEYIVLVNSLGARHLQNNNSRCLKQFYDKYALKWKIHDTLGRLGSLEDTFAQVYVYDLKEIHHYDPHNTFWDTPKYGSTSNTNALVLKAEAKTLKNLIGLYAFTVWSV